MILQKAKSLLLAACACMGLMPGLSSCADDAEVTKTLSAEKDFVLTVDAPEGFRSRAGLYYGDGAPLPLHLQYAIYDDFGNVVHSSDRTDSPEAQETEDGKWHLKVSLVEGVNYKALFWADQFGPDAGAENPYTVDLEKAHLDVDYETAFTIPNLESDRCDAYVIYKDFVAGKSATFTMKRPFCQVSIGSPEPSVVKPESPYHNKRVTMAWDGNVMVTGLSFADGTVETTSLTAESDPTAYPSRWPAMKISDFDNADFDFPGNNNAKFMYMAYMLVSGEESTLNLHIEGVSENYSYSVPVAGKTAQNTRLIVTPSYPDKDGFIDKKDNAMSFYIMYDPSFDGSNMVGEEVNVEVFHTLSWTLGEGVKSVTINDVVYTESGNAAFPEGSKIAWSAEAETGYTIEGASEGTVTMNDNQTLKFVAGKDVVYYTISWTLGEGVASITIGDTKYTESGSAKYPEGTKLGWTATASNGYHIDGDDEGIVTVNGDKTINVSAVKDIVYYSLSWTLGEGVKSITINGTNYTTSGTTTIEEGTVVNWSVAPKTDYIIDGTQSGSFTMNSDKALSPTATYSPATVYYTLSWTLGTGVSSVTIDGTRYTRDGSAQFESGKGVKWSATASSGYSIDGASSGTITMSGNKTLDITATYEPTTYRLSWTLGTGVAGISIGSNYYTSSGSDYFEEGERISWSAYAESGYTIRGSSSGTVTMNGDRSISVYADEDEPVVEEYTFSWTLGTGVAYAYIDGVKKTSSGSKTVTNGTTVSWSGTAASGYEMDEPSSGSTTINGSNDGCTLTAHKPAPKEYTFSWTLGTGVAYAYIDGVKKTSSGSKTVTDGTTVTWSGTAASGYEMDEPSSGSTTINGSNDGCTLTAHKPAPTKYTVTFVPDAGVASVSSNPSHSGYSVTVDAGTTVSWSATAKSGYRITSNASGSVTVNSNQTINIPTTPIPVTQTFSWTIDDGVSSITVNGTTYYSSGSITVDKGTRVSWSASAKSDYAISGSSSGSETMNGDRSVSVSTKRYYTVSISLGIGVASVTVNGTTVNQGSGGGGYGSVRVLEGSTVSVSGISADGGVTPLSIYYPGGFEITNSTSFTMPSSDCEVNVMC